jgi:hypothetical protein
MGRKMDDECRMSNDESNKEVAKPQTKLDLSFGSFAKDLSGNGLRIPVDF